MDNNATNAHADPKQIEDAIKGWHCFVKFGLYGAAGVVVALVCLIFVYLSFLP